MFTYPSVLKVKESRFCKDTNKIDLMAKKEDTITLKATVEELLPNMTFRVALENGMRVHAHLCGKMRMKNIRVLVGDPVTVEMSPYDLTKARIIYRNK